MSTPGRLPRDRDDDGRARNARPRDALGRPLPPGSVGAERIPDDLDLSPDASLAWAQDLLNRGLAFNAHEVLEGAWKTCPEEERFLWQGLAQLAVGITHVQRGNPTGAATVLRRAVERIGFDHGGPDAAPAPYAIDAVGLIAYAERLIADLERGVELTPSELIPTLLRGAESRLNE